jgi:hypothetical protein
MVAGYGVELISVLALGIWMLLNAAGVFMAASRRAAVPSLSAALFLAGLGLVADMVFIRSLRSLAGLPPGTYLPMYVFIPAVVVALLPLCLFLGAAFQRAADRGILHNHTLARAYTIECSGSVFGGLLSALMLHWGIQNMAQALVCTAITMLVAILAVDRIPGRSHGPSFRIRAGRMPALMAGLCLIALMAGSDK